MWKAISCSCWETINDRLPFLNGKRNSGRPCDVTPLSCLDRVVAVPSSFLAVLYLFPDSFLSVLFSHFVTVIVWNISFFFLPIFIEMSAVPMPESGLGK